MSKRRRVDSSSNPNAHPRQPLPLNDLNNLISFFKDPPNVDELMAERQITPSTASGKQISYGANSSHSELLYQFPPEWMLTASIASSSNSAVIVSQSLGSNTPSKKKPYRGLQLNFGGGFDEVIERNRENVFLATLYLKRKLTDLTQSPESTSQIMMKKNSKTFVDMATELAREKPTLKGVTSIALFSHYTRIVTYIQSLKDRLASDPSSQWISTKFSEASFEIYDLDKKINDANPAPAEINEEGQGGPRSRSSNPPSQQALSLQPTLQTNLPLPTPILLRESSLVPSSPSTNVLPTSPSSTPISSAVQEPRSPVQPPNSQNTLVITQPDLTYSPDSENQGYSRTPTPEHSTPDDPPITPAPHWTSQIKRTCASYECYLEDIVGALVAKEKASQDITQKIQKELKESKLDLERALKTIRDNEKVTKELVQKVKSLEERLSQVSDGQSAQEMVTAPRSVNSSNDRHGSLSSSSRNDTP